MQANFKRSATKLSQNQPNPTRKTFLTNPEKSFNDPILGLNHRFDLINILSFTDNACKLHTSSLLNN